VQLRHLFDLEGRRLDARDAAVVDLVQASRYGTGEGRAHGRLSGTVRWTVMSEDGDGGAWRSSLHGFIDTDDRATVVIRVEVTGRGSDDSRTATSWWTFSSEDPRYGWVNAVAAVGEAAANGELDRVAVFECVNELSRRAGGPSPLQDLPRDAS
jgi:hypothetical protein